MIENLFRNVNNYSRFVKLKEEKHFLFYKKADLINCIFFNLELLKDFMILTFKLMHNLVMRI